MNNRKNFVSAFVLQAVAILQGLIVPRLIITTFGSDVNGLVSSLTQFLSFISLLEGGLGAVVLAELYRPIEENDIEKVQCIVYACQKLFKRLAMVYVLYTALLAISYPLLIAKTFDFAYVCTLTFILSITILCQYLFAISNKLLLQACQKIYIVNFVSSLTIVLNLLITVLLIHVYPNIHIIKLCSGIVFLLQPIVYSSVVENKYIDKSYPKEGFYFKNRWSGFAQNLAYFININTDIVVVTVFLGFASVSVYSIYMLAINALRQIISNAAISYQSALGKYYVIDDKEHLINQFYKFEIAFLGLSVVAYCTCLHLINPFVSIYTSGVTDANYYQPVFAFIMTIANMVYCIREPYRVMVLAAGKFKETNSGAVLEAVINLVITLSLVFRFGLVGVAIGTFIAITYRLFYFIEYLRGSVLFINIGRYIKLLIELIAIITVNTFVYSSFHLNIDTFISFIIYGAVIVLIETLIVVIIHYVGKCLEWGLIRLKQSW